MKTIFSALVLSVCGLGTAFAGQTADAPLPDPTDYQIIDQGANHRVWQRQTFERAMDGTIVPKLHSFTELCAGLNYLNAQNQWTPSQETIETSAQGAVGRQCQYSVIFANNLNTTAAIDLLDQSGKELKSNILGLGYYDSSTGQAVLIAQVKDSTGQLISSNQVLYADAFEGDVSADVQYTYAKDGLSQDVILTTRPPDPSFYGLNPDTTTLEVFTEFIDPPQETVTVEADSDGTPVDETVSWGTTLLGHGKAFQLSGQDQSAGVSVQKKYVTLQGRKILIEIVPLKAIANDLKQLPDQSSISKPKSTLLIARSETAIIPKSLRKTASTTTGPMKRMASVSRMREKAGLPSIALAKEGYVLDYVTVSASFTNYVFRGDSSYLVNGNVNLAGVTEIDGGAVIKFNTNNASVINVLGTLNCKTAPYSPAVFTTANDSSVGEGMSVSGGSSPSSVGLLLSGSGVTNWVDNVRFKGLQMGIHTYGNTVLWDAQFIRCATAVKTESTSLYAGNVLMARCGTGFAGSSFTVQAENVTYDQGSNVTVSASGTSSLYLTNSLITGVTSWGNAGCYTNYTAWLSTNTGVYQSVGAGSYYLATASPYTNAGSTNISILADLAVKTTYPPVVYTSVSLTNTVYSPRAPRDTNGPPSLGYHYDPLDYCFGSCTTSSNLTFTAGTAIGWFESGSMWAIAPAYGVSVTFTGTATAPCVMARYSTIQDQFNGSWSGKGYLGAFTAGGNAGSNLAGAARANLWFTKFYGLANDPNYVRDNNCWIILNATHSEFHSGQSGGYGVQFWLTNCLIECSPAILSSTISANGAIVLQDCTMHRGYIGADHSGGATWPVVLKNSAFDNIDFSQMDAASANTIFCTYSNNAYIAGLRGPPVTNMLDRVVTNFNWQSSWFGNYYLPPASPLIDSGNITANLVGLYHFTTQTNQTVEGTSTVDIGYHYVATDAFGNPLDSNSDGIADYLEDANGDGLVDNGELPWNLPATGLKLWLKADTGVSVNATNQINTWTDQSGNANNAGQGDSGYQPILVTNSINGYPAVHFNGTNTYTNSYLNLPNNMLTGSTGAEAYVVVRATAEYPATFQPLWEMGGARLAQKAFPDSDGTIKDDFGSSTAYHISSPAAPLNQFNVYQVSSQSNYWSAWVNGTNLYQTSVNTVQFPSGTGVTGFGWYVLGGASYNDEGEIAKYFAGDIAEVIVFNRQLSTGERNAENNYLFTKYGLIPVVGMTGPTNNAIYVTGSNIGLSANAFEPGGGTIKQVEFFQNGSSLGAVTSSPFNSTWVNAAAGSTVRSNCLLTAVATGVNGLSTTSSVVSIIIDPPPAVAITNPPANAYLGIGPVNLPITATAGSVSGIYRVSFFQGTNYLGVTNGPPYLPGTPFSQAYTLTWSNAPAGVYTLTAVAQGLDGLSSTSSVSGIYIDTDSNGDGIGDLKKILYGDNPTNSPAAFNIWLATPNATLNVP